MNSKGNKPRPNEATPVIKPQPAAPADTAKVYDPAVDEGAREFALERGVNPDNDGMAIA